VSGTPSPSSSRSGGPGPVEGGPVDGRPIRVLVAKAGLDGHDRGAKVVAAALRDAGFEVVYTGLRQTPETIVEAALQEDVDVVGLSMHSGAHMTLFPRVLALLRERGLTHVVVTGGGIIPPADASALEAQGVHRLFPPGTPTRELAAWIRAAVAERRAGRSLP
jgi:methylmalonyl-CoA mutase, C-terminal domain